MGNHRNGSIKKKKGIYVHVTTAQGDPPLHRSVYLSKPTPCVECGRPYQRIGKKGRALCADCAEREANDG